MQKLIFAGLIILSVFSQACTNHIDSDSKVFAEFQKFLINNKKAYSTIEEFNSRFVIFKQNYAQLEIHNKYMSKQSSTFELGITPFMDISTNEFRRTHLNLDITHLQKLKAQNSGNSIMPTYKNGTAPENFDWRTDGHVSEVKNQGGCGSCWAFSAIGNIEAQYSIKTGKSLLFSEQQLVDCDKVDQGCNGGLMEDAFKNLQTSGLMSAEDYSYTGSDDTCRFDSTKVAANVTGYHYAGTQDENLLKQILFENGPFAIAINASPLQFYFWGIFNPWFEWICSPADLNHGVLLVGYGIEGTTPYWIVKNSWGASWGEKGYFRIIANKGACGVNTYVISAEVSSITEI